MSLLSWIFGDDLSRPGSPALDMCTDCEPHDDDLLDKTEIKSSYEQMDEQTRSDMMDGCYGPTSVAPFFRKKIIFTFKCKKCGRVKQETHTNDSE